MRTYSDEADNITASVVNISTTISSNIIPDLQTAMQDIERIDATVNEHQQKAQELGNRFEALVSDVEQTNQQLSTTEGMLSETKAQLKTKTDEYDYKHQTMLAWLSECNSELMALNVKINNQQRVIGKLQNFIVALSLVTVIQMIGIFIHYISQ